MQKVEKLTTLGISIYTLVFNSLEASQKAKK